MQVLWLQVVQSLGVQGGHTNMQVLWVQVVQSLGVQGGHTNMQVQYSTEKGTVCTYMQNVIFIKPKVVISDA